MTTNPLRQSPNLVRDDESTEVRSLHEFLREASRQEFRLEELLADPRNGFKQAQVKWSDEIDDPEFQKNVRIFRRLITGIVGVCERARSIDSGAPGQPSRLKLESRLDELSRRITLPDNKPLTLTVLLGYRFALEQLLAELGDASYLRARASELYGEPEGSIVTWRDLFNGRPPPLFLDGQQSPSDSAPENTRAMLTQLLGAKEAQDLPGRARRELKWRALYREALPLVTIAVLLFGIAVFLVLGKKIFLPVTAAVAGAALGRLISLRDEANRGSQLREFLPLFLVQLAVGVITGLVVSLVPDLHIINLDGANWVAAFSFAAGFSEATFLKLVSKIAGEPFPKETAKSGSSSSVPRPDRAALTS